MSIQLPTWGGVGTELNPYTINSANQLVELANLVNQKINYAGNYFSLTQNIDLSGIAFWKPIGVSTISRPIYSKKRISQTATNNNEAHRPMPVSFRFSGIFNGNDKTISNMQMPDATLSAVALFGNLVNATVKNLNIANANISAQTSRPLSRGKESSNYGTLAGAATSSTINGCSAINSTINGNDSYVSIGGLIGICRATTLINCSSIGGTLTNSGDIGGLVYETDYNSHIQNSFSTTNIVSSETYVGGLVASNNATIDNCYFGGSISDMSSTPAENRSIFIGCQYSSTPVTNCYYDNTRNPNGYVIYDGTSNITDGITAKSTTEMQSEAFVTLLNTNCTGKTDYAPWLSTTGTYPSFNPSALPVELTSFTANYSKNSVVLSWLTATETNNCKFEIERSSITGNKSSNWSKIGEVRGNGNSNSEKRYSFADNNISTGKYSYRLKQIDNDGKFKYVAESTVEVIAPKTFGMNQNYPNPFNPATVISYQLAANVNVELKVFDMLGRVIETLVNEKQDAGTYKVSFNASKYTSGIYVAKLNAGNFTKTIKMNLIK